MVKIRLARRGRKKSPSYRIVAVDSRRKRSALSGDLGYYDPIKKKLDVDVYLMNTFIRDGAQFSDGFKRILSCYLKPPHHCKGGYFSYRFRAYQGM